MSLDPKTFRLAMRVLKDDARAFKKFLEDKRLTIQEKTILNALLLLRDFKNNEVLSLLEGMKCQNQFVESQRLFCLGAAYNNLTHYEKGRDHLLESLKLNTTFEGRHSKKNTLRTLFFVYQNVKDAKGMKKVIGELESLGIKYDDDKIENQCLKFSYLVFVSEYDKVVALIPEMEKMYGSLNDVQEINYLYDLFEMYVDQEDLPRASEVIERIKGVRKYKNASMMKFLRGLIDYLVDGKALYLYEKEYADYPLIMNYTQCFLHIEKGDLAGAEVYWRELKVMNPTWFGEPFECIGKTTLFKLCLRKLLKPSLAVVEIQVQGKTMEEKLFSILNGNGPISKEIIHQKLWGREIETKDDLDKLSKVVQRMRKALNCEVKSVKGSYVIVAESVSKKVS